MTLLRLAPGALPASRFALSPLAETLSRLVVLRSAMGGMSTGPGTGVAVEDNAVAQLRGWLASDPFADGLVRLVTATKYLPEFVAIPPTGMNTRIDDELAAMGLVGDARAREALAESQQFAWASDGIGWADGGDVTLRAAEVFARAWSWFVEPDWSRRRAVMERDIRYRAGVLAIDGWRSALDGMARNLKWLAPDVIQFSTQQFPDRPVGETGLVFVPHTGVRGYWTCEAPPRIALVYPARGVFAEVPAVAGGLADLLGQTRSRMLLALRSPATSSQLALLLEVSLGTVSGHLAALRDAGMAAGRRNGRAVYYELTDTGADLAGLLAASRGSDSRTAAGAG